MANKTVIDGVAGLAVVAVGAAAARVVAVVVIGAGWVGAREVVAGPGALCAGLSLFAHQDHHGHQRWHARVGAVG